MLYDKSLSTMLTGYMLYKCYQISIIGCKLPNFVQSVFWFTTLICAAFYYLYTGPPIFAPENKKKTEQSSSQTIDTEVFPIQ